MCGICGELTFEAGASVRPEVLVAMREQLVHRGPDDQGLYVDHEGRAGLGFRRLRIIDLTPVANQPMSNEDGSVHVVFNGEIYNFKALISELAARGHRFRSHADTEVIVHLYEERGPEFVHDIDGMFAIAVWDSRRRRLVLARDRAGKKPLFYYRDARRFVFGSEIKAFFAHPDVPVDIDRAELPWYFLYGYIPHPATPYRDIRQVDPASVVVVDGDGRVETRRFWRLAYPPREARQPAVNRAEARERVRQLVTDSVARRLESDVPLGAFLSAGIDSTIVVGVMSRLMPAPVKTFTIGFEGDDAFDETAGAREVATRFGTDHTEFRVRPSAVDLIDRLIWHHDGPFGDSSAIPTYLVSQLTRQHVTVVLTGDGGDELFGGYLRFRAALAAERLPRGTGPLLHALLRLLPAAPHERHLLARARRFARFMHLPIESRVARWNSTFQDDLAAFFSPGGLAVPADPLAHLRDVLHAAEDASPLSRLLAANFESYLPDDLLVKTDRCTMASSLEARAPLLDTALAEYAVSLPDAFKIDGSRTKAILREAFADLIPRSIDRRPKTGFGVPLDRWFREELRDYVRDTLLAPGAASKDYLRQGEIRRLVEDHLAGRVNAGHRLWALVSFERWLKVFPVWTAPYPVQPWSARLMMTLLVAPFLSALALSLLLVPIARYVAVRFGYVSRPRDDRWHRRPVALFGGAAIMISMLVCALVFHIAHEMPVIVLAAGAMFTAGLVDDLFSLKPSTKLVIQIALASVLLFFDYRLNWLHSTFDTVLTLVWIVGLTNAFNLLDNMDGLCAGIAMIVGAALLIDLLPGGGAQVFWEGRFLAILLGATGGFLVYNVHPASIFMGDSGSLMLGFSLAAATLGSKHPTQGRSDVLSIVAAPVLVLLIPIFDTTLVTLSRWFSGRSASQGGRDHSSHRLVAIGLSERRAVALLWLLAAVGGGLGIALDYLNQSWSGLLAVVFLLGMMLFAAYLAGIRVYDDTDDRVKGGSFTPIVVAFMYKRRVAEVLLDFGLVTLCYYTAYRIRFEDAAEFTANFDAFSRSLPLVLGAQMVAFFAVGVYRGMWRHFGMMDSLTVARGVFFGTVTAQVVILYVYRFSVYSRTVFVIHGVLLLMAVVLTRTSVRMASEFVQRQRQSGRRVVIDGAGDAATLVIRELLSGGGAAETRILGFVDDDPRRGGIRIQGYPVLGGYSALDVLIRAASVDSVVISARHMSPERLHNLELLCSERDIRLSRLRVGLEPIVEVDEAKAARPRATLHQIKS